MLIWNLPVLPHSSPSTTAGNGWFQQTSTGSNNIGTCLMDEEAGECRTMKTGPNNARSIVWALGEFFFLFFSYFLAYWLMFYSLYRILFTKYVTGEWWRVATTKTGPDNAGHVIWALDEWSFLFFSSYFLLLTRFL